MPSPGRGESERYSTRRRAREERKVQKTSTWPHMLLHVKGMFIVRRKRDVMLLRMKHKRIYEKACCSRSFQFHQHTMWPCYMPCYARKCLSCTWLSLQRRTCYHTMFAMFHAKNAKVTCCHNEERQSMFDAGKRGGEKSRC